jgi:hypothetical protein
MTMTKGTRKKAVEAPVDTYDERPYEDAQADPEVLAERENRQPDQIADYHETHPTLKVNEAVEQAIEDQQGEQV